MSPVKVILALLLAFNAGLLTLFLFQTSRGGYPRSSPGAAGAEREKIVLFAEDARDEADAGERPVSAATGAAIRTTRTSAEMRRLYNDLLALGYSEESAERVLLGVALGQFASDMERIFAGVEPEFWRQHPHRELMEHHAELIERRRRYESAIAEALGRDPSEVSLLLPFMRGVMASGVPQEKQLGVMTVEEDYQVLQARIHARAGDRGLLLPEDFEAMRLLEQEKRSDLAAILTPEELELYEMHNSMTAHRLRHSLYAFEPTEQEFREIFRLHREMDVEFGHHNVPGDPEADRSRQEAAAELNEALRGILGDERFAEYERAQDHAYSQLVALAERLDVPRERAEEIDRVRELVQAKQTEMRADPSLEPEDRQEAARLLLEEARETIEDALGEGGYDLYKLHGGWWLNSLESEARQQ